MDNLNIIPLQGTRTSGEASKKEFEFIILTESAVALQPTILTERGCKGNVN